MTVLNLPDQQAPAEQPAGPNAPTPPQVSTPEQEPLSEGYVTPTLEAGLKGLQKSYADFSKGIEAATPGSQPADQGESWLGQGYELEDFKHPFQRLLPKTAYQLSYSSPELAGGLGSAALASETGPFGAAAAGGLGAGAMHMIHVMGPFYAKELRRTPDDPSGAFDRALKQVTLEGGLTAASWAAFGAFNPFKTAAKNLLLQTVGVQPAISMAGAQLHAVQQGRNADINELGRAYAQGAVGTAIPAAGFGLASRIKGIIEGGKAEAQASPASPEQKMYDVADDHYRNVDSGGNLDPTIVKAMQDDVHDRLVDANGNPNLDADRRIFDIVHGITGRQPGQIDLADIGRYRSQLAGIERQKGPSDQDKRLAHIAKQGIDAFTSDADRLIAAGIDPYEAAGIAQSSKTANAFYAAAKEIERIRELHDKVTYQQNQLSSAERWQRLAAQVISNKARRDQFSPVTQDMLRQMAEHKPGGMSGFLSRNFSSSTLPGLIRNVLIEHFGSELTGLPGAGLVSTVAGAAGKYMTEHAAEPVAEMAEQLPQKVAETTAQRQGMPQIMPPQAPQRISSPRYRPLLPRYLPTPEEEKKHILNLPGYGSADQAIAIAHRLANGRAD